MVEFVVKVFNLFRDGFTRMTVGKTLWKIVFIKFFVMFAVLEVFFFPNYLETNFETDKQRGDYVLEQLTRPSATN